MRHLAWRKSHANHAKLKVSASKWRSWVRRADNNQTYLPQISLTNVVPPWILAYFLSLPKHHLTILTSPSPRKSYIDKRDPQNSPFSKNKLLKLLSNMGTVSAIFLVLITILCKQPTYFTNDCSVLIEVAVPPVGVYAVAGCGADLLINIALTILGYVLRCILINLFATHTFHLLLQYYLSLFKTKTKSKPIDISQVTSTPFTWSTSTTNAGNKLVLGDIQQRGHQVFIVSMFRVVDRAMELLRRLFERSRSKHGS